MYERSLCVVLIIANNVDPDKMQHYAAFYLGLHCLPKFSFRGFQYIGVFCGGFVCLFVCLNNVKRLPKYEKKTKHERRTPEL